MVMNEPFWRTTIWTITIALLIGAGAGILATSYTSSYLEDYALELSKLTAPLRLIQTQPKQFPSSFEDAVRRFETNNLPSLVHLYPSTTSHPYGYTSSDQLTTGLILTTDGWILVPTLSTVRFDDAVVSIGDKLYPVEQVVESQASVSFLKISADALSIVGFDSGLDVAVAEQVFVTSTSDSVALQSILSVTQPQGVPVSSDVLTKTITLSEKSLEPGFIFSLNGDLLGVISLVEKKPIVIPSDAFLPQFRTVLEKGSIVQPKLGLETISLGSTIGMDAESRRSKKQGAFVPDKKSILTNGPADKAGIKPLDIILSYNGQPITEEQTLARFVSQSKPGEVVVLTIDRASAEMDVRVTLGEIAE